MANWASIVTVVIVLLEITLNNGVQSDRVPDQFETMGRVTLSFTKDGQNRKSQFAFEEVYDAVNKRSRVKIGHIGQDPNVYYYVNGIVSVENHVCKNHQTNKFQLVPELSWFTSEVFSKFDIEPDIYYEIGPTGIRSLLAKILGGTDYKLSSTDMVFRNMPTDLYKKVIVFEKENLVFLSELYHMKPNAEQTGLFDAFKYLNGVKDKLYLRVTVTPNGKTPLDFDRAMFTFDINDARTFDDNDLEEMESKLLLPVDCGTFKVEKIITMMEPQSFSLIMKQASKNTDVLVAYDHQHNYLRRETLGKSVDVWDIKEELMYHLDDGTTGSFGDIYGKGALAEVCSVLKVDKVYCPLFRPFKNPKESLGVLEFIGADNLVYMGQSMMYGKPVYVYESFRYNKSAPAIFGSKDDNIAHPDPAQYVTRFYFAMGKRLPGSKPEPIDGDKFLPILIQLYWRSVDTNAFELLDVLQISDFHWSLFGWDKKPGEMFMVPECFSTENDQLRIEMILKFDNVHGSGNVSEENREILDHNKFALENSLIDNIFTNFDASKMHLIDYELNFRPHHVEFNFVIADRKSEKNVIQLGRNYMTSPECSESQGCIELPAARYHHDCVATGSLISNVGVVAFCDNKVIRETKCRVYKDSAKPKYSKAPDTGNDDEKCELYQFDKVDEPPKKATVNFNQFKSTLDGYKLDFEAAIPGKTEKLSLRGHVVSYDVQRETFKETMPNHRFVVARNSTKGFEDGYLSLGGTKSIGDCERLCNLEADCRSFSFCSKSENDANKCIISRLDLGGNDIEKLIYEARPTIVDGQPEITLDLSKGQSVKFTQTYTLRKEDGCSINGRNFLGMFSQTDEFLRIPKVKSSQLITAQSAADCARVAVAHDKATETEEAKPNSMFAYCAQTNNCLVEKDNLVDLVSEKDTKTKSKDQDDLVSQKDIDQEMMCSVFRRKYQTYFHMSIPVVVPDESWQQQQIVSGSTVEECSHSCWMEFGESCHSFDFCSGQNGCFINKVATSDVRTEAKSGCLHYERDLQLDEMRREHMIGRHQLLNPSTGGGFSFGQLMMFSFLLLPMAGGLFIGIAANNHLDRVNILPQQPSSNTGSKSTSASRFSDTFSNSNRGPGIPSSVGPERFESERADDNGIQMEVIKKNHYSDDMDEPLACDF